MVKVGDDVWYCTTAQNMIKIPKLHIAKVIAILEPPPGSKHKKTLVKLQRYRHQTAESAKRRGTEGWIFPGYFGHKSECNFRIEPRYYIEKSERA